MLVDNKILRQSFQTEAAEKILIGHLLAGMGTITHGDAMQLHKQVVEYPTAIGNFELTGTSQRIFRKLGTAYDYLTICIR